MSVYPRLSPNEQHALLASIVRRSGERVGERTPVIVFDLDGTLFDNRPRTCAIFRELAKTLEASEPEHAAALAKIGVDDLAYLITDSLAKNGITDSAEVARIENFWKDRFFGDEHMKFDEPIRGAVEFARACHEAGATLVYLTGRDLPMMGTGSFRSLRDRGFPIGVPGTELVLKPDAAIPDEAYKRLEAPKLARVGDVIAIFDNEPANCNTLLAQNPNAVSVLLDTQHLPGAPALDPGVKVIADFAMR